MHADDSFRMAPTRPRWRSIVLRPVIMTLLLLSELALLAVIVDLWVLSASNMGFIKLSLRDSTFEETTLRSRLQRVTPLLWTTLPTLVVTLYRIFREAVVSALVVETPFIELYGSSITKRTKMKKSVYVDYRTSFSIIAWYEALKNGHILLGLCMLFSFVVSLALVPLAGGLFAEGQEVFDRITQVNVLSVFDSGNQILSSTVDYGRLLDSVSASWIDAAPYPAGTDGRFPLPAIEPVQKLDNYTISSDVKTSQLSLDCLVVNDATFSNSSGNKITDTTFSADDRNCAISGDILTISTSSPLHYMKGYAQTDCASWAGHTRVVMLYVNASTSGEWRDYKLISCIPSYWGVNGTLEVVGDTKPNGKVSQTPSFHEKSRRVEDLAVDTREQFEKYVMAVQSLNVGSGSSSASRFAELVERYIDSQGETFTAPSLIDASSTIYSAIYTMLCLNSFFPTLQEPIQQPGILSISENRLHVIVPVAAAMVAILVLLVIETVYLMIYLRKHPSILAEEPIGLVGAANLLHDSNIACLVATAHKNSDFDGRLRRPLASSSKRDHSDDDLLDRDCWIERDPATGRMRINVETRAGEEACAQFMHGHKFNPSAATTIPCHPSQYVAKHPVQVAEYPSPSHELPHLQSENEILDRRPEVVAEETTSHDQYRASSVYELGPQYEQRGMIDANNRDPPQNYAPDHYQNHHVPVTTKFDTAQSPAQLPYSRGYPSLGPQTGQYDPVSRSRSISEVSED